MRRIIFFAAIALLATASWAMGAYEHGMAHGIGIDTQLSQEYGFFSGFGTFMLALLGYSGLLVTLTHHLNCHHYGCWRIGRHREGSALYCRLHHGEHKPEVSDSDRLDRLIAQNDRLIELLERR